MNSILLVVVAFGFTQEYLRNRDIEREIARMTAEHTALEEKRLASLQLIDTLSSTYYVEGEARQSGLGKEGESLVILEGHSENVSEEPVITLYDDVPNPLRWYYYFFDQARFVLLSDV